MKSTEHPKTQSSLLEVMEETGTVDETTYHCQLLSWYWATQNPVEYIGTFPLPEAQLIACLNNYGLSQQAGGNAYPIPIPER